MTRQNAALVEQAASAADAMQQQAAHLDSRVGVFKLQGHYAVAIHTAACERPAK